MKKTLNVILIALLALALFGCEYEAVKGSGKAIELNEKNLQKFMDDKKMGFLYIKSAFDSHEKSERVQLREIERVAKSEKIDFYVFDAGSYGKDHTKIGIKQYSGTFAFYQNGEMKEELGFMDVSKDDVPSEVEKFIQNVKYDYFK
ncbi:UNVERIFIED_ORG: hypothetical protein QFZ59_004122 [Bacillus sp. B2I3]|nr:hypothetical protein [Bacillus sp. B2I3]